MTATDPELTPRDLARIVDEAQRIAVRRGARISAWIADPESCPAAVRYSDNGNPFIPADEMTRYLAAFADSLELAARLTDITELALTAS